MDCSPPGSSVHGVLQAKILEWAAVPFSRGSSWPRDQTQVSCTECRFFTIWDTGGAPSKNLFQVALGSSGCFPFISMVLFEVFPYCQHWKFKLLVRWDSFIHFRGQLRHKKGFLGGSGGRKSASDAGDVGSIPGSGPFPGGGDGNPLQDSCLEGPMDRGAWWATVHGVTKSQTQLSDWQV